MEDDPLKREAYNQHYEQFRDLNGHMWKIPMIAVTLTGGLWLGVQKVEGSPLVQQLLLFLAFASDLLLIFVLYRIRYVMRVILEKLKSMAPDYFVDAAGDGFFLHKRQVVAHSFALMLFMASVLSLGYGLYIHFHC